MVDPNITMVRGADGILYYMTPTGSLTRVPDADEVAWDTAVGTITAVLETTFNNQMATVMAACHQHVQIVVPEIDLDLH